MRDRTLRGIGIPFIMGSSPHEKTPDQIIELIRASTVGDWLSESVPDLTDGEFSYALKSDLLIKLVRLRQSRGPAFDRVMYGYQAIGWLDLSLPLEQALSTIEPFTMHIVRLGEQENVE